MLRLIVIAFIGSFAVAGAAHAQLFTNGNFNNPPGGTYTALAIGSTALTGWTVDTSPSGGIAFGTTWGVPVGSGTQSLLLATTASGSSKYVQGGIQQTISTVPGQLYSLSIYAEEVGTGTSSGTVSFGGLNFTLASLTTSWPSSPITWTETAASASTILNLVGFKGTPITTGGVVVADFTVTVVPTVWLGGTSSDWGTAANWNTNSVPNAAGLAITFGTAGATGTVSIASGSETVGTLNFVNSVQTTISGSNGNYLVLDNTGVAASAAVNVSGNHSISANIQLNSSAAVALTSGTLNVSGVMGDGNSGPQTLSLSGNGTLNLSGANTMSGTVNVSSGRLLLSNNAALQNATLSGAATFAGGITAPTFGGLAGAGNIALLTNALLTVGSNGQSTTYSGVLSGAGSFTKTGSAALTFGGANTFSGATLVSGGSLVVGNVNALQDSTLDTSGIGFISFGTQTSATVGGLTHGGTLKLQNAAAQPVALSVGNNGLSNTSSAAINGSGSLNKVGGGLQVLSGNNSYAGGTSVSAGTMQFLGPNALPNASPISLSSGGGGVFSLRNDGGGSGGTINVPSNLTLTVDGTTPGATIDVGSLTPSHSGNTVAFGVLGVGTSATALSGRFTFTGANGYLQSFTGLNLPGSTGDNTILNPISTSVNILGDVGNLMTSASGAQFDTLYLDGNTTGNIIGGAISDASFTNGRVGYGDTRLTKTSASQWILAGANTYSGPTLINGGTLQLGTGQNGQDGTLGSNTTVTNNQVLAYDYFGSQTASYAIGGAGTLAVIGPGGVTLTASNTYTGATIISAGTLGLGFGGSILQSPAISMAGGTTFDVSQLSDYHLVSGQTLSGTGNYTVNGAMTANSGSTILPGGVSSGGTLNVGSLTLTPGSVLNFDLGHNQDLINVTNSLTLNGASLYLYDSSGTKQFSTPGTYPIIAYPGFLTGDPTTLSVANPSSSDIYTFSTSSTVNGSFVELNILAALAWTGSAGSPFHWSVGNNWTSHAAIQTGQAAYFQGTTGTTNVNDIAGLNLAGIVFASNAGSFNISGNDIQLSGQITNSSAGTQTLGLNIQLSGNQTVTAAGSVVLNGVISDGGNQLGISTAGNGTVILGGANTYSGTTNVTAGKLRLANALALQNSTLNTGPGGLISFAAGITSPVIAGLTGSGNVALATVTGQGVALNVAVGFGQNTTYGGVLSSTGGSLIKQGPGTLTLAAPETYTGATAVSGGILQLMPLSGFGGNSAGWTLNTSNGTPPSIVSDQLTLTFGGSNSARSAFLNQPVAVRGFIASFDYQESSGTAGPADGVALVWQNSGSGASALGATGGGLGYGGISPSAAVEINVYNGSPPIRGTNYATNGATGTYLSTTASVDPASGHLIGVTLTYDGVSTLTETMTDTTTNGTYSHTYAIGNLVTTVGGASAYLGFTGGDGGVTSTQTITNFSYNTSILPPSTALSITNGATVDLNGVNQTVGSLTSIDGQGSQVLLGGGGALTVAGSAVTTFDGVISGGGGVTVQGGQLTLTGPNSYSGVTSVVGGGTLQLFGANGQDGTISSTSGVNDNGTLLYNINDSQTIAYAITGQGSLRLTGGGMLTLTTNNSYHGATTINGGTLQLGDGTPGDDGSIAGTSSAADNGALVFDLAGSQTATYRITGSGSLTMAGMGMLTLSGSNTYSGGTFVAAGTLVAANSQAIADGTSLTVGIAGSFAPVIPGAAMSGELPAASAPVAPVPEPGALALLTAAVCGAAARWIRRRAPKWPFGSRLELRRKFTDSPQR